MNVTIALLLVAQNIWGKAQMSINNNWQYVYTVEYYVAIKRNEVLIHTITLMNLRPKKLKEHAKDSMYLIP